MGGGSIRIMNRFSLALGALLAIRLLLFPEMPAFADTAPGITLTNPAIRLTFSGEHGEWLGFDSIHRNISLLEGHSDQNLWTLVLLNGLTVLPSKAESFTGQMTDGDPLSLEMVWSGFNLEEAPRLRVIVKVSLESSEAEIRWRIRLEETGALALQAVHFPRINSLTPQAGETVAVPEWMGVYSQKARSLLNPEGNPHGRWEWEYPGILSMQFLAWYSDQGLGVMLSTEDAAALRKKFAVYGGEGSALCMEAIHQPPIGQRSASFYEPPYETVISLIDGGWFSAASRYAQWGRQQYWVKESRLKNNWVNSWARDTGAWVWNRGFSQKVLVPALDLQAAAGLPVNVFWHWWHGCAYDAGFPEYLPPREGIEPFQKALANAHSHGVHALVYMNQRLWGMTTRSWAEEGAEKYAVKNVQGAVTPEVYNTFMKVPCASMCMGTPFWRNKYAGLAAEAFNLGVDGIYMDQACSSLSCYDPSHGHPLGGGSYWMEGFRSLESDIRSRCTGDRTITLAGEGCGEAWLPHLDLMLSLQVSLERYAAPGHWNPVPLFQAVYHDCVLLYGNYSSLTVPPYDDLWPPETAPREPLALLDRKFATQFRLEQARSFVWGQQPTLANFTTELLVKREEEMSFFLQLAGLRHQFREFLQEGILLKPLPLETPSAEVPLSRLSIYAGQQDAVKEYKATIPLVLGSAWLSPKQDLAVAMVNISDETQSVSFQMQQTSYPIPFSGKICLVGVKQKKQIGRCREGMADIKLDLGQGEAGLILFQAE